MRPRRGCQGGVVVKEEPQRGVGGMDERPSKSRRTVLPTREEGGPAGGVVVKEEPFFSEDCGLIKAEEEPTGVVMKHTQEEGGPAGRVVVKEEPRRGAGGMDERPIKSRRTVKSEKTADSAVKEDGSTRDVFCGFPRPTLEECETLSAELFAIHGKAEQLAGKRGPVVDALFHTMLSQNTTAANSTAAYAALKAKYPTWEDVRTGNLEEIEDTIRVAGLAKVRAQRIQHICETLHQTRGEISLEHLWDAAIPEIKRQLAFPGCGPKTISCVLLLHLGRPDFAVDTHVFRLAQVAGWVPSKEQREAHNVKGAPKASHWPAVNPETTYLHLNQRVPDHLKYMLHCNLIAHGRTISPAKGPKDPSQCPIARRNASSTTTEPGADGSSNIDPGAEGTPLTKTESGEEGVRGDVKTEPE